MEIYRKDSILTTGQIAKYCQVDPRTVKRWIDEGGLKAYALPVTGFLRVRTEDFVDFLKSNRMPLPATLAPEAHVKPRLLLVDDEPMVIKGVRRILSKPDPERYEFEEARDGYEAGRKITLFQPDLVLLDIEMPKLDGLTLCRTLKKDPQTRKVRVLILSAHGGLHGKKLALEHGADGFIEKPLNEDDVRIQVEKNLVKGSDHE